MEAGGASSRPAVSISVTRCPSSTASPSRRSRVRPGMSDTSAVRLAVRRLNRVDLPTLGRPTMAMTGGMLASREGSRRLPAGRPSSGCVARSASANAASSIEGQQPGVVGQHEHAAAGHHRRDEHRRSPGPAWRPPCRWWARRSTSWPLDGGEPEAVAGQHRPGPGAAARQLGGPSHLAVVAGDGDQLAGSCRPRTRCRRPPRAARCWPR